MKKAYLSLYFLISILIVTSCGTKNIIAQDNTSKNIQIETHSKVIFPRPFFIAIDDLGWNLGDNDGATTEGPYRIGLKRHMELSDYKCVVDIAKKTGIRLQALFIMGEMDRENICATVPSSNVHGASWDNSSNVCNEQIEIMNYVKDNAAWLEFGLHGVGHEYWPEPNKRKRAEWYCTTDNHPWKKDDIQQHIDLFRQLMGQYGLNKENGHSFPESFVPCAYGYHWNPNGEYSTGSLLGAAGVKYTNTLFSYVEELNPPQGENAGGIDHGVLVVNRINYGNEWYDLSSLPTTPIEEQKSDIIETHWTNWLVQDDFLQADFNQEWVDYYKNVATYENRYVAKNTEQFSAQWLYKKYTKVKESKPGIVTIDNTQMPIEVYDHELLHNMVLKFKLSEGEHVSQIKLNGNSIQVYDEQGGYGLVYLPMLERKSYDLSYTISENRMPTYLANEGTYNIYNFTNDSKEKVLTLRTYGTQYIKIIGLAAPKNMRSDNPNLTILKSDYNKNTKSLTIQLKARDIQGETGTIFWE